MEPGDRITWRTVNGTCSGVIVEEQELGFLVKLDNSKYVIINQESIVR